MRQGRRASGRKAIQSAAGGWPRLSRLGGFARPDVTTFTDARANLKALECDVDETAFDQRLKKLATTPKAKSPPEDAA
jgi:hypothetical protein